MMQSDGWTERIEEVLPKWCVIRLAGWDALLKAWRGWMGGWKGHCNGIMVIFGKEGNPTFGWKRGNKREM
jgi:hypothetical protein